MEQSAKTYHIGGISMSLPIILAAGVCKDPRHLIPYQRNDVSLGATVVGTATPDFRGSNEGVTQWPADWTTFLETGFGLNSWGMPNSGIDDFLDRLNSVPLTFPAIASVGGFSPEEVAVCVELADSCPNVSAIEINWGCGNTGKIPDAYSYENASATLSALEALHHRGKFRKPIWIKLSPYLTETERVNLATVHHSIDFTATPVVEEGFVERMLQLLFQYPFVSALVFSNTLANCRKLDADGKPVTTPFDGRAGLSGPILKKISIGLLQQAARLRPSWCYLDLIGCGGILTGDDAVDYFEAGAAGVQCASGPAWHPNGQRFFADLIEGSKRLQDNLSYSGGWN